MRNNIKAWWMRQRWTPEQRKELKDMMVEGARELSALAMAIPLATGMVVLFSYSLIFFGGHVHDLFTRIRATANGDRKDRS